MSGTESLRSACVATAGRCDIAPGAPIGGCDPPHPASMARTTQLLSAQRLKPESRIFTPPEGGTLRRLETFGARPQFHRDSQDSGVPRPAARSAPPRRNCGPEGEPLIDPAAPSL